MVKFNKRNTIVIASSVSNGGGASVLAVEQDDEGLIDGLAVGEPNVNPTVQGEFLDQAGRRAGVLRAQQAADGLHHAGQRVPELRKPCARERHRRPQFSRQSPARCADLKARVCSPRPTLPDQATEAQAIINAYGILPEQNLVQPGYSFANVAQSISVTYANTYGRFSVLDNLCSFSFAANGGVPGGPPVAIAAAEEAQDLQHQQRHSADLRRSR